MAWRNTKQWQKGLWLYVGIKKVFWGWFLIIGDTVVLILLAWKKQTADKDIRGMQRNGGNHCCGQMDNSIGLVHTVAFSVCYSLPGGKKKVGGLVSFIKVPSVCLHEGSSPPSVCWHHTEFCPPLRLLSEPGRQGQTRRCHHSKLGFLRGKTKLYLILISSYIQLLLIIYFIYGCLSKNSKTLKHTVKNKQESYNQTNHSE